jgi:hypothetical protein
VHDVQGVKVSKAFEQLVDKRPDHLWVEAVGGLLENLEQIALDVLEYQIDDALLPEGLFEFDQVRMFHHFEDLHLSHCSFFDDFVFLSFLELLYRQDLLSVVALALEDHSVGTLSYDSQYIVFLH